MGFMTSILSTFSGLMALRAHTRFFKAAFDFVRHSGKPNRLSKCIRFVRLLFCRLAFDFAYSIFHVPPLICDWLLSLEILQKCR